MSRCLWCQCGMSCHKSFASVQLFDRFHGKSTDWLPSSHRTTQYENYFRIQIHWISHVIDIYGICLIILFFYLRIVHSLSPTENYDPIDLCNPSPCGLYSQCRVINEHVVCSCLPGYIGSAPNCRPECVVSSECAQNRACINQKCADPCVSMCGLNARCQVINHNPICSCSAGFTGDPFIRCIAESKCMMLSHVMYYFVN